MTEKYWQSDTVIKNTQDSKYTHFVHAYITVHAASARSHCENPGAKSARATWLRSKLRCQKLEKEDSDSEPYNTNWKFRGSAKKPIRFSPLKVLPMAAISHHFFHKICDICLFLMLVIFTMEYHFLAVEISALGIQAYSHRTVPNRLNETRKVHFLFPFGILSSFSRAIRCEKIHSRDMFSCMHQTHLIVRQKRRASRSWELVPLILLPVQSIDVISILVVKFLKIFFF